MLLILLLSRFRRPCAARASGAWLGACLLLAGWLIALPGCAKAPPDARQSAQNFLQAIVDGRSDEAYQSATFAFRALQSATAFKTAALDLGLMGGRVGSVGDPLIEERRVRVRATVVSVKGEERPFNVTLVQEKGAWRVLSLRPPRSIAASPELDRFSPLGRTLAFNEATSQSLPDERSILRLVREAMDSFAQAIAQRSFHDFYKKVSLAWQAQLTERQLERAFQGFITQEVNLVGVAELGAKLDAPPMISSEGLLLVSGHYPTKPYEVVFVFKFIYEEAEWKLFGLDVNLRQAETEPGAKPPLLPADGEPPAKGGAEGEKTGNTP